MSNNEPVGFTNLVTYAYLRSDGKGYVYGDKVVTDIIEWLLLAPEPTVIINVLQITEQQAAELEQ